jgi:hypothetical protein
MIISLADVGSKDTRSCIRLDIRSMDKCGAPKPDHNTLTYAKKSGAWTKVGGQITNLNRLWCHLRTKCGILKPDHNTLTYG